MGHTKEEKAILNKMSIWRLAKYCDRLEKDIQESNDMGEIKDLQKRLSQADKLFDQKISTRENALLDRA